MGLAAYAGEYRPHWGWSAAFLYGAVSTGMDAAGGLAHRWWEDGRLWQDNICPCCDHPHGDGGGWGDFPGFPDGPEDHGRTAPRPVGAPVQG
ncbi:hypothetical protein ACFV2V_31215 [Streptomyces sp. NPDC059698]|uniref:hypothetical protein n=1 Tax=unclassified Streptomyces TaxID=2593676 RepID=UPI00093C6641|nr:hypothetical protein [Streptomyces sp. CB02366]OKJ29865.1 hypothetical protein AMK24_29505 [Streptomyces sp. CB02366]